MKKMKPNRLTKTFGTLGFAAILAGNAFLTACGETAEEPENSDKNENTRQTALELAQSDYDNLVLAIKNADSLTATSDYEKVEIQGKNLKQTRNNVSAFVETTAEGTNFEYTLQQDGYHKNVYTGTLLTASTAKTMLVELIDGVEWTGLENDTLTKEGENISATYNKQANNQSLTFTTIDGDTFTINNINSTLVNLPEYVDDTQEKPPVQDEFKITAENYQAVKDAVKVHIDYISKNNNIIKTVLEIKSMYLTKSESSEIVDTIGALFTAQSKQGNTMFYWEEMTIPTQEELSYEKFYKNQVAEYDRFDAKIKTLYSFVCGEEEKYAEMVDTLKSQTFGADYASADWCGWRGSNSLGSDGHTVVMLKDNVIYENVISIYRDNSTSLMEDIVEKYFKNQEQSKTTWKYRSQNIYEISNENYIFLKITEKESELDQ